MKKKRIIPVVLFRDGYVVQTRGFANYKRLGLLGSTLRRLEEWGADEIVVINISPEGATDHASIGRTDVSDEFEFDFRRTVSKYAGLSSVPLTIGGGIRDFEQAAGLFEVGADKILLNTGFHTSRSLGQDLARSFGSQAVVLGVDYATSNTNREVVLASGTMPTGRTVLEVIENGTDGGVGEFFLHSIDRDGKKQGLDLDIAAELSDVGVPLIVCGGVGTAQHITEGLSHDQIDGVAAANYFQHVENSVQLARQAALSAGIFVRRVNE